MRGRRILLLVVLFALVLVGLQSASFAASYGRQHRVVAAPRSVKKADRLVVHAVSLLTRDYAQAKADKICRAMTSTARHALGGSSCVAAVRLSTQVYPIKCVTVKKIAFRHRNVWAVVSGYLNRNHSKRLSAVFVWQRGCYRLDHSTSDYRSLLG